MRGAGESRPFSPLPSTSGDHYTIALNDSLFIAADAGAEAEAEAEAEAGADAEAHADADENVPPPEVDSETHSHSHSHSQPSIRSEPEVQPASVEAAARDSLLPLLCAVAMETDRLDAERSRRHPRQRNATIASLEPLTSTMETRTNPPHSHMAISQYDSDSDSDCEIIEPLPKRIVAPIDAPSGRLRSRTRKRIKRSAAITTIEIDCSPVARSRSPISQLDTSMLFDLDEDDSFFDRAMTYLGDFMHVKHFKRLSPTRIVDTVDLCGDTFKPTPVINEVIVIDSDTSYTATSPSPHDQNTNQVECTSSSPGVPKLHDCPVCLESLSSSRTIVSTFCGHVFCTLCVRVIMSTTKRCPTCRKTLKGKGYHQLFL
ncbi:uncharacterized protein LOC143915460 [Arctopsyche grandis]|uniref:uncharacterized protein LOC143915460 n=1 Tax=Arctopsyche grandis TaxID=121162 RepID=UPI00406D7B42